MWAPVFVSLDLGVGVVRDPGLFNGDDDNGGGSTCAPVLQGRRSEWPASSATRWRRLVLVDKFVWCSMDWNIISSLFGSFVLLMILYNGSRGLFTKIKLLLEFLKIITWLF